MYLFNITTIAYIFIILFSKYKKTNICNNIMQQYLQKQVQTTSFNSHWIHVHLSVLKACDFQYPHGQHKDNFDNPQYICPYIPYKGSGFVVLFDSSRMELISEFIFYLDQTKIVQNHQLLSCNLTKMKTHLFNQLSKEWLLSV